MHVPRACVVLLTVSLCYAILRTELAVAQSRADGQTMEEIQSWLKSQLEGKLLLTDGTPAENKTTSLSFNGCVADWRVEYRQGSERGTSKLRLTLRGGQLYQTVKVTSKGRVNQAYAVEFPAPAPFLARGNPPAEANEDIDRTGLHRLPKRLFFLRSNGNFWWRFMFC